MFRTTITLKEAQNAFRNISFSYEERGRNIINAIEKEYQLNYENLLVIAPQREEEIKEDIIEMALKYDSKMRAYLSSLGRTASPMITGPAKFPVEKNNKRWDIARKKEVEATEYLIKIVKKLKDKYSPKEKEKTILEVVEETKEKIGKGYIKQLAKESLTAKLYNYANISLENLKVVKEIAIKETGLFTSRHKIHRIIENLEKKYIRIEEGTANKEFEINNIKIIDSEENNRIEIYFDGKPNADVRSFLKGKGFKWSPTKGAWQNYRNKQRLIDIKEYITNL